MSTTTTSQQLSPPSELLEKPEPFDPEEPENCLLMTNSVDKANQGGKSVANVGASSSYKFLSWREKDRRRRFRDEWRHMWLVVPHGNFEVQCLVCHKVMTQRKLDTIKRHTVRRHAEVLEMEPSERVVLFERLLLQHNNTKFQPQKSSDVASMGKTKISSKRVSGESAGKSSATKTGKIKAAEKLLGTNDARSTHLSSSTASSSSSSSASLSPVDLHNSNNNNNPSNNIFTSSTSGSIDQSINDALYNHQLHYQKHMANNGHQHNYNHLEPNKFFPKRTKFGPRKNMKHNLKSMALSKADQLSRSLSVSDHKMLPEKKSAIKSESQDHKFRCFPTHSPIDRLLPNPKTLNDLGFLGGNGLSSNILHAMSSSLLKCPWCMEDFSSATNSPDPNSSSNNNIHNSASFSQLISHVHLKHADQLLLLPPPLLPPHCSPPRKQIPDLNIPSPQHQHHHQQQQRTSQVTSPQMLTDLINLCPGLMPPAKHSPGARNHPANSNGARGPVSQMNPFLLSPPSLSPQVVNHMMSLIYYQELMRTKISSGPSSMSSPDSIFFKQPSRTAGSMNHMSHFSSAAPSSSATAATSSSSSSSVCSAMSISSSTMPPAYSASGNHNNATLLPFFSLPSSTSSSSSSTSPSAVAASASSSFHAANSSSLLQPSLFSSSSPSSPLSSPSTATSTALSQLDNNQQTTMLLAPFSAKQNNFSVESLFPETATGAGSTNGCPQMQLSSPPLTLSPSAFHSPRSGRSHCTVETEPPCKSNPTHLQPIKLETILKMDLGSEESAPSNADCAGSSFCTYGDSHDDEFDDKMAPRSAASGNIVCHVLRFGPNQDLLACLRTYVKKRNIGAAFVVSCCGSVKEAVLRMADSGIPDAKLEIKQYRRHLEIVSLSGSLSRSGHHLHMSLADSEGRVVGGHLAGPLPIHTTAEVMLGEVIGVTMQRRPDLETGYDELVVSPVHSQ